MKAQVDKANDSDNGKNGEKRAGGLGAFLESGASAVCFEVTGSFENEEADRSESGGTTGVEDAFEGIDAKSVGEGDFVFSGNEDRANGFGNAAEKEEGAKASEVHGVDVPEPGIADVGLEGAPAKGANGVAKVDGYESEKEVEIVDAANRGPEAGAAELAEIQRMAEVVEKEGHKQGQQDEEPPLPRLKRHID